MAACAACGGDFAGEPWHYAAGVRVHVSCPCDVPAAPPPSTHTGSAFDTWSAAFPARYGGHCVRCGGVIVVGELIARRGRPRSLYRHLRCITHPAATG